MTVAAPDEWPGWPDNDAHQRLNHDGRWGYAQRSPRRRTGDNPAGPMKMRVRLAKFGVYDSHCGTEDDSLMTMRARSANFGRS